MATNGKKTGMMYPEWDFAKMWGDFKMPEFADFKMPEINVDALIETQQKNIEALNLANKAAVEGWQAFAKKQAELWQEAFEETGTMAKDMATTAEPTDKLAMQAAFAKTALESSVSNAREAQAMASKTANKAIDIVYKRFAESLDEVVSYVEKNAPKVPTAEAK